MTPVLCESFNNNNNSVGVCGKMGDYPEYQEFQKQSNVAHYPDHHHAEPTYTYTELASVDGGDGVEGWSEGDDGSVDGLGREVYLAHEHGTNAEGRGEAVYNNNNRGPAYQGGFTTTNQHTNFYNADIAMYESYQESQGEAYSSSLSPKKKGKGGRKKNLHPPTPTIMKHRRNMANARERKRMNGLNDAFERLREVVPNVNTEQKMSKIETLLVAQTYIKALAKLMDSVAEEEEDEMVSRISLRN